MHTTTQKLLESILTSQNKALKAQIKNHPFWKSIENGTLEKKRLALFALQDYWLVKQAPKIDTLLIASIKDKNLEKIMLERLAKQVLYGKPTLVDFAKSVEVTDTQLANVTPLTGCMALTTFFYWMIDNTGDMEKIVSIDASKEIFSSLCVKVKPMLMKHYNLNEKDVAFFTVHEGYEERLGSADEFITKNCKTADIKKKINEAIRLSLEHELLFYDTLISTTL